MIKPVTKTAALLSVAYLCLLCGGCSQSSNLRWDAAYASYRAPLTGEVYAEIDPIKD